MFYLDVWTLWDNGDKYVSIEPYDLPYYQEHFIGKRMFNTWEPKPFELLGKSKPMADIIGWMLSAPIMTEKAVNALAPLIGEYVEFLPFGKLRKKEVFAVNVLFSVDCLDYDKTEVVYFDKGRTGAYDINQFYFDAALVPDVPIFKAPDGGGMIFVRRPFVDAVIMHQLRGFQFADPSVNPFLSIALRNINVVPGVPE